MQQVRASASPSDTGRGVNMLPELSFLGLFSLSYYSCQNQCGQKAWIDWADYNPSVSRRPCKRPAQPLYPRVCHAQLGRSVHVAMRHEKRMLRCRAPKAHPHQSGQCLGARRLLLLLPWLLWWGSRSGCHGCAGELTTSTCHSRLAPRCVATAAWSAERPAAAASACPLAAAAYAPTFGIYDRQGPTLAAALAVYDLQGPVTVRSCTNSVADTSATVTAT